MTGRLLYGWCEGKFVLAVTPLNDNRIIERVSLTRDELVSVVEAANQILPNATFAAEPHTQLTREDLDPEDRRDLVSWLPVVRGLIADYQKEFPTTGVYDAATLEGLEAFLTSLAKGP